MKTLLTAVAVVGLVAAGASADLINYYDFEGNANDTGGLYTQANGHDSATNASETGTSYVTDFGGRTGGAVYLDRNLVGAITLPDSDADTALGSDFTWEAWMYTPGCADTTTQQFMVANNYNIMLVNNHNWGSGTIQAAVAGSGASVSPRYVAGTWLHVALVVDSAGNFTHYINPGATDGSEVILSGTYTPASLGTTTQWTIGGGSGGGYGTSTSMYLDDLAMWNEALSYATLSAHYTAGNPMLTTGPSTPELPGDANDDGIVDLQDFGILKDNYGTTEGATYAQADFNGDGAVDLQDFGVLKQNYGKTVGDMVTAVPEPTTMGLLALAGLGLIRRRR